MIRPNLPACVLLTSMALPAFAENTLVALPAPDDRPYPYEILGLKPGDHLNDVQTVYSERSEADPTSETVVQRVQSPNGAVFEFTYQLHTSIGDIGLQGRVAKAPQDHVIAKLASDVMEQRPMAFYRSIRKPTDELPAPLELKAQIEQTYGTPSRVEIDRYTMTLTYAWSTDGFVADLDAIGKLRHEETRTFGGWEQVIASEYELCGSSKHYQNTVDYRFEYPRKELIKPDCTARFTVKYRGEPGMTSIDFAFVDYELGRQHMAELDRQIVEALTGETVEASDLDL